MLSKMKVIYGLYMQKFITSNTRHLFKKKKDNPTVYLLHKIEALLLSLLMLRVKKVNCKLVVVFGLTQPGIELEFTVSVVEVYPRSKLVPI